MARWEGSGRGNSTGPCRDVRPPKLATDAAGARAAVPCVGGLVVLGLCRSSLPVLHFRIETLGRHSARVWTLRALLATVRIRLRTWGPLLRRLSLLLGLLGVRLATWILLLIGLFLLLSLLATWILLLIGLFLLLSLLATWILLLIGLFLWLSLLATWILLLIGLFLWLSLLATWILLLIGLFLWLSFLLSLLPVLGVVAVFQEPELLSYFCQPEPVFL